MDKKNYRLGKEKIKDCFLVSPLGNGEWLLAEEGKGLYTNNSEYIVERLIFYINKYSKSGQIKFSRMEDKKI